MIVLHDAIVLVSCCLNTVLGQGIFFSFGTLFADIMSTFESTRAETALIQSTLFSAFYISGVFTGILTKKFGLVKIGIVGSLLISLSSMACYFASSLTFLVISVGVIHGIGVSCLYICTTDVICHVFSGKKQFIFLSISSASSGIGGTIYPYLLKYLRQMYGWREALLLIGALSLNAVPGCILWKKRSESGKYATQENNVMTATIEIETLMNVKTEAGGQNVTIEKYKESETDDLDSKLVPQFPDSKINIITEDKKADLTFSNSMKGDRFTGNHIKAVLCNICYMLYVFGTMLAIPIFNVILILIGDIYKDNGLTNDDMSLGLLLVNLLGIFGRFFLGIVMHSRHVPTFAVPFLDSMATAVVLFAFTYIKKRWQILVLTGFIGVLGGMIPTILSIVTLKLVGPNLLSIALGVFLTLNGIGNLVSGPINGYMRDMTGSYTSIFYIGMVVQLLAALVYSIAYFIRRKQKVKKRKQRSEYSLTNL